MLMASIFNTWSSSSNFVAMATRNARRNAPASDSQSLWTMQVRLLWQAANYRPAQRPFIRERAVQYTSYRDTRQTMRVRWTIYRVSQSRRACTRTNAEMSRASAFVWLCCLSSFFPRCSTICGETFTIRTPQRPSHRPRPQPLTRSIVAEAPKERATYPVRQHRRKHEAKQQLCIPAAAEAKRRPHWAAPAHHSLARAPASYSWTSQTVPWWPVRGSRST